MYSVAKHLPVDGVPAGSTLLVVGPPMTGKRSLAARLLTAGLDDGEAVAVVTADGSVREMRQSLADGFGRSIDDYPVGIIDCTGDAGENDVDHPLDAHIGSPADLTGIGMELMTLLEELYTDHSQQIRVGLTSLTTMSMYTDPGQVVRFLHVLSNRVSEVGGFGVVVAHSDTVDEEYLTRLRSFVDGVVEVRERDQGGTELRVLGLDVDQTGWATVEGTTPSEQPTTATAEPERTQEEVAPSLRDIADRVGDDGPTLTVLNPTDAGEALTKIRTYFDRHNVEVRTATTDLDTPRSVALLHRGDDLLASESVTALRNAIEIRDSDETPFDSRRTNDLLANLDGSVYGTGVTDKDLLVDVSHNIEMLAGRTGGGQLHAGFQAFSRLVGDDQSMRIYRRLAEQGIDVHLYGADDAEVPIDGVTLHSGDSPELTGSWFVVFDGGGVPESKAALLSFELDEPNTYRGFWTYDDTLVDELDTYLSATYLDGRPELSRT